MSKKARGKKKKFSISQQNELLDDVPSILNIAPETERLDFQLQQENSGDFKDKKQRILLNKQNVVKRLPEPLKEDIHRKGISNFDFNSEQIQQEYIEPRRIVQKSKTQARSLPTKGYSTNALPLKKVGPQEIYNASSAVRHFPIKDLSTTLATKISGVTHLDLSSIDRLTDLFFKVFNDNYGGQSNLCREVKLDNCIHITDAGIKSLSEACPSLHEIYLNGCKNVTSSSLIPLQNNCQDLTKVSAIGSRILSIPESLAYVNVESNYTLIYDPVKDSRNADLLNTFKVVVWTDDVVKLNVPQYFCAKTIQIDNLPTVVTINDWKTSNGFFVNFIQCNTNYIDLFLSKRTLVILPYDPDDDDTLTAKSLASRIVYILGKSSMTMFLLLSVCHRVPKSKSVNTPLNYLVEQECSALSKSIRGELDKKIINDPEFGEQQKLAQGYQLVYALNKVDIQLTSINTSDKKTPDDVEKYLTQYIEKMNSVRCPQFKSCKKIFTNMMKAIGKSTEIESKTQIVDKMAKSESTKVDGFVYEELLQYMSFMGKILLIKYFDTEYVVTDIEWFSKIINAMTTDIKDTDGPLCTFATDAMPAWTIESLSDTLKHLVDKKKLNNVLEVLDLVGVIYAAKKVFVRSNLPYDIPSHFAYYWPEVKSPSEVSLEVNYIFNHAVPADIITQIIGNVSRFRKPVVLWQRGILITEGAVDILIHIPNSDQTKIVLSGLVTHLPVKESVAKECLNDAILNQYHLIINYFIYHSGLYARVESKNIDNITGKMLPNHHVQLLEIDNDFKLVCQWCGLLASNVHSLWKMYKALNPTFSNELEPMEMTTEERVFEMCMTPYELHYFEVFIASSTGFAIGLRNFHSHSTNAVFISVKMASKTCTITYTDVNGEVQLIDSGSLTGQSSINSGDMLRLSVSVESQPDVYCVTLQRNSTIYWKGEITAGDYCPLIVATDLRKLNLDFSLAPEEHSFVKRLDTKTWETARVETVIAMDNTQYSAIGEITSVDDIAEQVYLKFDDKSIIDQKVDISNIFPFGRMKAVADKESSSLPVFEYKKYLENNRFHPLPEYCFPKNVIDDLKDFKPAVYGYTSVHFIQCRRITQRAIVVEQRLKSSITYLMQFYQNLKVAFPLYALIPNLSLTAIKYPSRQLVTNLSEFKFHFLCPVIQNVHFFNAEGVSLTERIDVMNLIPMAIMCHLLLLDQKELFPVNFDVLIPGAAELSREQVDGALRRLLHLSVVAFTSIYPSVLNMFETGQGFSDNLKKVVEIMKMILPEYQKAKGLVSSILFKSDTGLERNMYMCKGHVLSDMSGQALTTIPVDLFKSYCNLITCVNCSSNNITDIPVALVEEFKCITEINFSHNALTRLPDKKWNTKELTYLNISDNQISSLPSVISNFTKLTYLNIADNPLKKFPDDIYNLFALEFLDASNIGVTSLKESIVNLSNLKVLLLAGISVKYMPNSLMNLKQLKQLDLSGVRWIEIHSRNAIVTTKSKEAEILLTYMSVAERDELFKKYDKGHKGNLDFEDVQNLNAALFKRFNRLESKDVSDKEGGFPSQILSLTNLEHLNLSYQGLKFVPDGIRDLKKLNFLNVYHNPKLEALSGALGALPLQGLMLKGCPSLKTPPKEIISRGFRAIYGYLKKLQLGSVACKRTKLMMVGLGGAGKTSLVRALMSASRKGSTSGKEAITDGIDIAQWTLPTQDGLTYSVWDFAGQTVYYNTHQFFLSNRAVYLLLWNVRLGYEHAGLDFWCSSIACHAPKAPILVVGTHCDQIEKHELPEELMMKRYPQITGFYYISSPTGLGVDQLIDNLITTTLKEKYMGEEIPESWLNLEQKILSQREDHSVLDWEKIELFATDCGIIDKEELNNAVQFLHDLGALHHFQSEKLKSKVVINPQWIVDVLACVVSVHNSPIKDGVFRHSDMNAVWKDYSSDLLQWLLGLTEEFDLTFPLMDGKANLVPCLLPDKVPNYVWPDTNDKHDIRETKMVYRFSYLPSGLFNRAQVRLYQFSDESFIWRKGSLLHKNQHLALILQTKAFEMEVKVQGPRPENILFMIHEVIEGLIHESFHGVEYDYFLPCTDCLAEGSLDPCMFAASKIRRATEFKAPFLQCDKFFHTLTMTEIQAIKPPESGLEYHSNLERMTRDLQSLEDIMMKDITLYYCKADLKTTVGANPSQIKNHLEKAGFRLFFPCNDRDFQIDQLAVRAKNSQLIIICISNAFENDEECQNFLYFVKETLLKKILLICIGEDYSWLKRNVGMLVPTEVFVNMTKDKNNEEKYKELESSIKRKIGKSTKFPKCFISYCWTNSHNAVKLGTPHNPEALGWGDPRDVKEYLEKNGVSCWLDIERTGQKKRGLFADIAEGLRHAKVMVACISQQYAESKNCSREFEFATVMLKIPIVLAIFGTGHKWQENELGMLSLGYEKIDFQHENPTGHRRLLDAVLKHIPTTEQDSEPIYSIEQNYQVAYQELFELGQRKILRQLSTYADAMDTTPYPRLITIDILPMPTEPKLETEKMENAPGVIYRDPSTKSYMFCLKLLCEHEMGWHVVSPSIPCEISTKAENDQFLIDISPYLTRLFALLKHSSVNLNILNSPDGHDLLRSIETMCGVDGEIKVNQLEYKDHYIKMRRTAMDMDSQKLMGNMDRCHLPSGKVIWLCKEHQKSSKVTVLGCDDVWITTGQDNDEDALLSDIIQEKEQHDKEENLHGSILEEMKKKANRDLGKLVEANIADNMGIRNTSVVQSRMCTIS